MHQERVIFTGYVFVSLALIYALWRERKRNRAISPLPLEEKECEKCCLGGEVRMNGVEDLIGRTPMVRLPYLSELLGVTVLAKMEMLSIGGSSKDRVARELISTAHNLGKRTVYEGSSGSTGISLALLSLVRGMKCVVALPDDQSEEKYNILRSLGANIVKVRPAPIVSSGHYVNKARDMAQADSDGYYCDQFENPLNQRCHYNTTGPEIWGQTNGKIDCFIAGAGTGGTIAGVSRYLKEKNSKVQIVLADPQGSSLLGKVKYGAIFCLEDKELGRKRTQVDSIVEGIGLNRLTGNFDQALIDRAYRVTDMEVVEASRLLLEKEGIWAGSSTATNIAAVMKHSKNLPKGSVVVTIICDSGSRHLSKLWNREYLNERGL